MLVRVTSAAAGIADYLETGRKAGREFERDLIDDRHVLEGDLALTETLIESIHTTKAGSSRYLHITLGFAERFTSAEVPAQGEINIALMRAAADTYRELLMAAYDRSEYCWYAEAHIPKVTHDIHSVTGEAIERLPHVHIVLPMRNLVSGKYLNPTGLGEMNIKYQQAIQEVINGRLGVKSPLDSPRTDPPSPFARHNPAIQGESVAAIRQVLLDELASGSFSSFSDFVEAAQTFGTVRLRAGRDGTYVNVKPAWAAKGMNFKEVTKEKFAEQVGRFSGVRKAHQREAFEDCVSDWLSHGALEARYLNSSNRKAYRALSIDDRATWLYERASIDRELVINELTAFDIKFQESHDKQTPNFARAISALQRAAEAGRYRQPPESFAGMRDLSALGVVSPGGQDLLLLSQDAPQILGGRHSTGDVLRREGPSDRDVGGRDGAPSRLTVAGSLRKQLPSDLPTDDQLRTETSPALLIRRLEGLGISADACEITVGKDGAPRIRIEDKHYNLGDVLTKRLGLKWAEARSILVECHARTLADELPPPDKELWQSFNEWRVQHLERASSARESAREDRISSIQSARQKYRAQRRSLARFAPAKRHQLLAQSRAEMVVAIETAQQRYRESHVQQISRNAQYRVFLTELANGGNLAAIAELRRSAPLDKGVGNTITGPASTITLPLPRYRVDHTGKVSYFFQGDVQVADSTKGVEVIAPERQAYALALKVAVARYGSNLTLSGDESFKQSMLQAARDSGLEVSFRDASKPNSPPIRVNREFDR